MSVGARVGDIELKEIEEWPGRAGINRIDAGRKQWLRAKTNGAIGDRRSERHTRQINGINRGAAEINHIAGFGGGDVEREDGGIGHAIKRQQASIEIGDGDGEFGALTERQTDDGASCVRGGDRVLDELLHVSQGKAGSAGGFLNQIAFGDRPRARHWANRKCSAERSRTDTSGACGGVHERKSNAVNDDNSRRRGRGTESRTNGAGEGSKFIHIVSRASDANPADYVAILEQRHAAAVHGIGVTIENIHLAGDDA